MTDHLDVLSADHDPTTTDSSQGASISANQNQFMAVLGMIYTFLAFYQMYIIATLRADPDHDFLFLVVTEPVYLLEFRAIVLLPLFLSAGLLFLGIILNISLPHTNKQFLGFRRIALLLFVIFLFWSTQLYRSAMVDSNFPQYKGFINIMTSSALLIFANFILVLQFLIDRSP